MLRRFVPVVIGMGTLQLNTFLDTLIAMWPIWVGVTMLGRTYPLDKASNLILAVTTRLYQFPLGVFGIAVATAAFPLLARHADEPHAFTDTLRRGLRLSLFIGLPASLGLVLVRRDLTAVLFGHGGNGLNPEHLERSAAVLMGFAPGVWAYSLNHVFTRAFYARKDTRTPMKLSIASMVLNLALNIILIWRLREAGLAWSTSFAAIAQCIWLAVLARKRLCDGPLLDAHAVRGAAKIALASLVMTAAVWAMLHLGPARPTWTKQLLGVALACGVGVVSYLGACMVLRVQELHWLARRRAA
jgi:putative peptidoglycan lipid II flippase